MQEHALELTTLPEHLAIAQLPPDAAIPDWATAAASLVSITRTAEELSVVAREERVPQADAASRGWRALRVSGVLEFELVGILAAIAGPLRDAGVSLFAVSTFDTDYVLVSDADLGRATDALVAAGHRVRR